MTLEDTVKIHFGNLMLAIASLETQLANAQQRIKELEDAQAASKNGNE